MERFLINKINKYYYLLYLLDVKYYAKLINLYVANHMFLKVL